MKSPRSTTCWIAGSISCLMAWYCAFRSTRGMCTRCLGSDKMSRRLRGARPPSVGWRCRPAVGPPEFEQARQGSPHDAEPGRRWFADLPRLHDAIHLVEGRLPVPELDED